MSGLLSFLSFKIPNTAIKSNAEAKSRIIVFVKSGIVSRKARPLVMCGCSVGLSFVEDCVGIVGGVEIGVAAKD